MRIRTLLVVSALTAAGLAPAVGATSCTGVTTASGATAVALPQRPSSDTSAVSGFSLDPQNADRAWVWTGSTVLATADGGCSWVVAFEADRSMAVGVEVITSVVANGHPGSPGSALLATKSMLSNTSDLYFSEDGLTKWTTAGGVPTSGKIIGVAQSLVDPKAAFFTVTQVSGYLPRTFASTDGGRTWAAKQAGQATVGVNAWRIHPHPSKASDLWAASSDPTEGYVVRSSGTQQPNFPLYHSTDGGASWTGVGPTNTQLLNVVPAGSGARIAALDYLGTKKLYVSDDGATFTAIDLPPTLSTASMAHGRGADDTFLASATGESAEMYRWDKSSRSWKVIAKGGFTAIQSHRSAERIYWLRGDKLMYMAY